MSHSSKELMVAVDNSKACLKELDFVLAAFPSGWKYYLLHVQTQAMVSSMLWADADMALLANDGQRELNQQRLATTTEFMQRIFVPKAAAHGAEVEATILRSDPDSSAAIGEAICEYVAKQQPAALVLMRADKGPLTRFFMGSVSRYCAVHSLAPVIVVPA